MTELKTLTDAARDLLRGGRGRVLLGLAGPPGSGKSTAAEVLAATLPATQVVQMDGYHLDDELLTAKGLRDVKGAPHTFDCAGFAAMLTRLRRDAHLYLPRFDRKIEIARAAAVEILPETRLILVEGNYLLHDRDGWQAIRPLLDACWYLDVPEDVIRARLLARWTGLGHDPSTATRFAEANDLPNARLVRASRDRADRVITDLRL